MKHALAGAVFALLVAACGRTPLPVNTGSAAEPGAVRAPSDVASGSGAQIGAPRGTGEVARPKPPEVANEAPPTPQADHAFGAAKVFDNLTILPVISTKQEDIGPITSLEAALAKKSAVIREMGAEQSAGGGGAQVNSLVIENMGAIPIYVLAGTIVKGGNQDRQIGDDFIVGAHTVSPVEAYCVEHGRWTPQRDGVATGGQFGVVSVLTDTTVRTAAQYKHDQGEVWSKVADVNAAHRKEAASGTLMATMDASDVVVRRGALAQEVEAYLRSVSPAESVVGFAYAVDGKVRSVRWFSNHKVFQLFRGTLVNTAAMEAMTVQAENVAAGRTPAASPPVAPATVAAFVDDIQDARVKEQRSTPAMNVNQLRESGKGYSSSTMLKPPSAQPSAPPKPVSTSVSSF